MNLENFSLKVYIRKALEDLHFKEFTPIQKALAEAYPFSKNILAKAPTGSGKTHAFLLPIFQDLREDFLKVQAVIVCPTKELSMQLYQVASHIASFSENKIDIRLYVGGTDRNREIRKLQNTQPQIVIGTPGKIKALASDENVLKIYTASYYVVDEMDMTLDGGYEADLDVISGILKESRMLFFSATIEERILHFAKKYLAPVEIIEIKNEKSSIEHIWIPLKHRSRTDLLLKLLETMQPYFAMIFVNQKATVSQLASVLNQHGYRVQTMHGDLTPRERKRVLQDCIHLKTPFLIATDLAARGIDLEGVTHIINYELPSSYEFYLHRSGRTGRMNREGMVYSFYDTTDDQYLNHLAEKGIVPKYMDIQKGELVEYKGRNTRQNRQKPQTDYYAQAAKYVPKPKKVSPGYKKKRKEKIESIALKLKQKKNRGKGK